MMHPGIHRAQLVAFVCGTTVHESQCPAWYRAMRVSMSMYPVVGGECYLCRSILLYLEQSMLLIGLLGIHRAVYSNRVINTALGHQQEKKNHYTKL